VDTEQGIIDNRNLDEDTASWEHAMERYRFSELLAERISIVEGLVSRAIKTASHRRRSENGRKRRRITLVKMKSSILVFVL
jgi:hypothetical protein